MSFGSSACQNLTGSLPICYNTVISGENLLTGCVPQCLASRKARCCCLMPYDQPAVRQHPTAAGLQPTHGSPRPAAARSMWVNLILGIVIYLGFVAFRGMKGFEFYHARLVRPLSLGGRVALSPSGSGC